MNTINTLSGLLVAVAVACVSRNAKILRDKSQFERSGGRRTASARSPTAVVVKRYVKSLVSDEETQSE
jgi:hypothetical protein